MTDSSITIQTDESPAPVDAASSEARLMEYRWRSANAYSQSRMVPAHFFNNPQDCFVVIELASQLGVPALTALQNIFMISGRPGFKAQFAVALANKSKVFAGPIRHKVERGDGKPESLAVTAYAPTHDGDTVEVAVSMAQAMKEGWTKNSKYKSIPEQMLRWRSSAWLINLYCPEVLLGLQVHDDSTREFQSDTKNVRTFQTQETPRSLESALKSISSKQEAAVVITEETSPSKADAAGSQDQEESDEPHNENT